MVKIHIIWRRIARKYLDILNQNWNKFKCHNQIFPYMYIIAWTLLFSLQILVDNSQMCTEPNLVVPLAYFLPLQVILFGDEAQLPPDVVSERARRLGFAKSMFHRYSHKAMRLTQHYRMVGSGFRCEGFPFTFVVKLYTFFCFNKKK